MTRATPVTFLNRHGFRLFGILEEPSTAVASPLALVLLSPGVKMRVGPQGLYRRIAELALRLGMPVLRFDFHGLGDSEGRLPEELLRDVYNHIEVGRFVEDTIDALDWLKRERGIQRVVLAGLCGGAITGLLTGEHDRRVAGLFGIGLTAVLASRAADASRYMTTGQLEQSRQLYVRRLLSPTAWFRLLTFQTDNRLILRLVRLTLDRALHRTPPSPSATPLADDNANPRFPPAFFSMASSGRPMLLVFGGSDRLHFEFEEKFVARHHDRLTSVASAYDVHVVADANHVLSLPEWQSEMLRVTRDWLVRRFPDEVKGEIEEQPA